MTDIRYVAFESSKPAEGLEQLHAYFVENKILADDVVQITHAATAALNWVVTAWFSRAEV